MDGLPDGFGVLVEVPKMAPAGGGAVQVLREDMVEARFGLPADLDGDGAITSDTRNTDYAALPVVAIFTWRPTGEDTRQFQLATQVAPDSTSNLV